MLNASLAESSKGTYRRAWRIFNDFSIGLFGKVMDPPLDVSTIALFVVYLHNLHLSYKTINTYLSALAYVHKILRLPNPTNQFLITRLIRGSQSLKPSYYLRLPITIHIFDKLVASLHYVSQSFFRRHLLTAMFLFFLFAFNTFARVDEIALTTDTCLKNLVLVEDVKIIYLGTVPSRVLVTFRHFKHSKGQPHILEFDRGETQVSPIEFLLAYLKLRGKQSGPLFVLNNGQVVSRSLFDNQLKKCLLFCGLDSSRYKSHIFCI